MRAEGQVDASRLKREDAHAHEVHRQRHEAEGSLATYILRPTSDMDMQPSEIRTGVIEIQPDNSTRRAMPNVPVTGIGGRKATIRSADGHKEGEKLLTESGDIPFENRRLRIRVMKHFHVPSLSLTYPLLLQKHKKCEYSLYPTYSNKNPDLQDKSHREVTESIIKKVISQ